MLARIHTQCNPFRLCRSLVCTLSYNPQGIARCRGIRDLRCHDYNDDHKVTLVILYLGYIQVQKNPGQVQERITIWLRISTSFRLEDLCPHTYSNKHMVKVVLFLVLEKIKKNLNTVSCRLCYVEKQTQLWSFLLRPLKSNQFFILVLSFQQKQKSMSITTPLFCNYQQYTNIEYIKNKFQIKANQS